MSNVKKSEFEKMSEKQELIEKLKKASQELLNRMSKNVDFNKEEKYYIKIQYISEEIEQLKNLLGESTNA